ncbi:MAG: hypothetical protein GY866_27305 [Proteobacteria bacterium]|nr:hypothetical protein [Pseudomonadota bacterium]
MDWIAERSLRFFIENFPAWTTIAWGGPVGILWACACLYTAGYLKRSKGFKTGYSRKVFHFLVFASVAAIHTLWGVPAVCLFGGSATLVVFYAVVRGPGHLLYEAMAREKDEPHRTYFVIVPYFATLAGGLAANILFGQAAVVGYLVTGLGDAVGEPFGTRFGRHTYKVPSFRGVKATRSLEGSTAVFVACLLAIAVGIALSPGMELNPRMLVALPVLGLICALVEAVSPHGWDNAFLQIVPAYLTVLVYEGSLPFGGM